jgi:hypothetical protein
MRDDEAGRSMVFDAKQLSDDELIGRLKRCVAQDRQLTARLLQKIATARAGVAVSRDETVRGPDCPDRVAASPSETVCGPDRVAASPSETVSCRTTS